MYNKYYLLIVNRFLEKSAAMNVNHVIKTCVHKVGIKTACQSALRVLSLDVSWGLPPGSHQMLCPCTVLGLTFPRLADLAL